MKRLLVFVSVFILGVYASSSAASAADTTVTHKVHFDINQGSVYLGRVTIGLFGRVVPKTVKNFYELAQGIHEKKYEGTKFHRVIPKFMIQGGDVDNLNGRGGWSIWGRRFDDENFIIKHSKAGLLSMANAGKDTNGSQFFITVAATPWLDGKHVVFGEILAGMDIVKKIEKTPTNGQDAPNTEVVIQTSTVEQLEPLNILESYFNPQPTCPPSILHR